MLIIGSDHSPSGHHTHLDQSPITYKFISIYRLVLRKNAYGNWDQFHQAMAIVIVIPPHRLQIVNPSLQIVNLWPQVENLWLQTINSLTIKFWLRIKNLISYDGYILTTTSKAHTAESSKSTEDGTTFLKASVDVQTNRWTRVSADRGEEIPASRMRRCWCWRGRGWRWCMCLCCWRWERVIRERVWVRDGEGGIEAISVLDMFWLWAAIWEASWWGECGAWWGMCGMHEV